MEAAGHKPSHFPGEAYNELGQSIPDAWWSSLSEGARADTGEATTVVDNATNDFNAESTTPRNPDASTRVETIPLSKRFEYGKNFWKNALNIPDDQDPELGARHMILGSFFRDKSTTDAYGHIARKYSRHTPSKVNAFGLMVPTTFEDLGDKFILYPFTDEALREIHQSVIAAIEKGAKQRNIDSDKLWEQEAIYWGAPLEQAIFERNHVEEKIKVNRKIQSFWREKTKDFDGHPIGPKCTAEQTENFHNHLKSEGILTSREIELVTNFQKTQDEFAKKLTDDLKSPIRPNYQAYREKYDRAKAAYAEAVELYNAYKPNSPLSPYPKLRISAVTHDYAARLAKSSQQLEQYQDRVERYLEQIKSRPAKVKVIAPPKLPAPLPTLEKLVDERVKSELNGIFDQRYRQSRAEYVEESDFRYKDTVVRKLKKGTNRNFAPYEFFVKDMVQILGTEQAADERTLVGELENFQNEVDHFSRLKFVYTEAETLWGPAPVEVTRVCYAYQRRINQELEDNWPQEMTKAHHEATKITRKLASDLGLLSDQKNESIQVVVLPTGIVAKAPERSLRSKAGSPLGDTIIGVLPDEVKSLWVKVWQTYEINGQKDDKANGDFDNRVVHATGQLVERYLQDYISQNDSPETLQKDLQRRYHFVTDRVVNKNNGNINPQMNAAEIAALSKIMPYFGDFIYAVKKPRAGEKITLKSVQNEIVDYLSGAKKSPPRQLLRGGVLNIDVLKQLVAQDDPGAELTINLLANSLGISMYNSLKTDERKIFEQMVEGQTDVSRKSFYQAFGNMVDDPEKRSELMKRVLFASYFGQYIVGKAPAAFSSLMDTIRKQGRT